MNHQKPTWPRLLAACALCGWLWTLSCSGGTAAWAQDAPAADAAAAPAAQEPAQDAAANPAADKTFSELLTEWKSTYEQLVGLEKTARAEGATDEAKTVYITAVDQANKLLAQLQAAAIAEIKANPGNDQATETLVGIMVNASRKSGNDRQILSAADQLFAANAAAAMLDKALNSTRMQPYGRDLFNEIKQRLKDSQANNLPQVKLVTSKGDIVIELFEDQAPNTVANFISLVKAGKYNNVPFHRVIEGFMAQTGDFEKKDGSGGPGYTIKCECERADHRQHFAGTLSMAHAGKDTGGSQFFVCFAATPHLDGKHTVFGRIVSGFDVLDNLTRTHSSGLGGEAKIPGINPDTIVTAEVVRDRGHEYKPETTPDPAK